MGGGFDAPTGKYLVTWSVYEYVVYSGGRAEYWLECSAFDVFHTGI